MSHHLRFSDVECFVVRLAALILLLIGIYKLVVNELGVGQPTVQRPHIEQPAVPKRVPESPPTELIYRKRSSQILWPQ